MSENKICPILLMVDPPKAARCREGACAWWDHFAGACCLASGADYIRAVSDSLDELQEKTPASEANADEGKVETYHGNSTSKDITCKEDLQG